MRIGKITIPEGIFLAPMAGVTDSAFRQICVEKGAEYVTTEMISAKAIKFGDRKTEQLVKFDACEYPIAVQLFGSEEESIGYAARFVCEKYKPSAIDINMGCPVPKIAGNGDGSVLMRDEKKAAAVMKAAVNGADVPVTVKIRSGWSQEERNAIAIAKIAEDCGIAAVFVHGRTRMQMYAPPVDLDIIAEVKAAVKIPVVGNGDIYCAADAEKMKSYTGCDGVMIARGALGNPWIFEEMKGFPPPAEKEKYNVIMRHMELMKEKKSEKVSVFESRKHLAWYIKGIEGAAAVRDKINRTETFEGMADIIRVVFGGFKD